MVRHNPCPRCGGQLLGWNDIEKSCLQCGHIVYHGNPLLGQGRLDLGTDFDDKTVPHTADRGGERKGEPD
jgi:hypothetical protein